jgi:4-hydroxybenzoate polyprenyltransferase
MRALGRLLRLSLAPTAIADIVAGTVAGAGDWPGGAKPFLLMLASLGVYHGGMALNDWRDRAEDRTTRPDRPVPSGKISARLAFAIGLGLLLAGPAIALLVSLPCALALGIAAAGALVYDLALRGPMAGPLLLALCRGANLAAGLALGTGGEMAWPVLLPALLYGAYVFAVSRLARLEDTDEAARLAASPSLRIGIAGVLLVLAPCAGLLHPLESRARTWAALMLVGVGAAGLIGAARHRGPWSREDVTWATGLGLRRLLVFTAAVALSAGGPAAWIAATAILAGYPVAYALRGVFPPS